MIIFNSFQHKTTTQQKGDYDTMKNYKTYSLRIQNIYFCKIQKIAEKNDRSINKQIIKFLKNQIEEYEKINGKIKCLDENGCTISETENDDE